MQNQPGDLNASLLTSDHQLQAASASLQQTQQLCAETEQIGVSILGELHGQRETLANARDQLSDVEQNLSTGQRTIRRMLARTLADKLILVSIVALLLALIGLILWYEFVGKKHKAQPQ
jgi:vesicle transport through interaction with t-SNAREs protein 1